ncbi:MAG: hypothetical protein H6702_13520 [Myxococcales bacterium]|nr:hypothetical protein [Myxococcales bacterium]
MLLVSDLHLGEACKEHSRIEYLKRASQLDQHICAFLDHHRQHRLGGQPWRLILGGDLLDFLQVTLVGPDADEEARRFGLGTDEAASRWKFERLVERHRMVFVYLADFVGAGHRIEVVQGNHDAELFWPAVQAAFVGTLVELYFGPEAQPHGDREAFRARIRFNPWFYHQPGLLYFEHGHRFDDFCVTPPQLCPLRPQAEDELVQPLSGLAIRYFANQEPGFRTHDKEHWGLREYAAYYREQGLGRVISAGRNYLSFLKRTLSYHLEHGRHSSPAALLAHRTALDALAATGGLDRPTLEALDQLSAPSAMASPRQLYIMLGGGEWSAAALMGALLVGLALGGASLSVTLGALAAGLVGCVAWVRLWRGRVDVDVRGKLARKAEVIGRLLGTPVVAFGHAHAPRRARQPHKHTHFYVNTGCFLPPSRPHAPDAPCTCTCTYVTLPVPGPYERPTPELRRWCCVAEAPAPFKDPSAARPGTSPG